MEQTRSDENEAEESVDIKVLMEQMTIYKSLNKDLARKIQDLKKDLTDTNQANLSLKRQIVDKDQKINCLSEALRAVNAKVVPFINTYVTTLQTLSNDAGVNFDLTDENSLTPRVSVSRKSKLSSY
jgi:chromosome segregation ATPase